MLRNGAVNAFLKHPCYLYFKFCKVDMNLFWHEKLGKVAEASENLSHIKGKCYLDRSGAK